MVRSRGGTSLGTVVGRASWLAVTVGLALTLAACNPFASEQVGEVPEAADPDGATEADDDAEGEVARIGVLRTQITNFPTLDPQIVTNGMWYATQSMLEGLVLQNEDGTDVIPGTAERWDVSEDGTVYTFYLREDARWSNGESVTAGDFEWTFQRLLDPQGGSPDVQYGANSYQPSLGIEGADDYLAGATEDWSDVGIEVLDDHTLEFTLVRANPLFLLGLTHPSMQPLHPATLEEFPQDWQTPENWVGNGPYALDEWVVNSRISLVPNEEYWDQESVRLERVETQLIEGDLTPAAYESGEVDIMPLQSADQVRFEGDPELEKALRVVPANTVAYLALLRSQNPALEDGNVRRALSLGLDRETIARAGPELQAGPSLVPESVPEWDASLATPTDLEQARQLLADAGYPDGDGLTINILSGSAVPLLDAIVDRWQEDLGIEVRADVVEVGVYVERRFQVQDEDYLGFYIGYFGGLPTMPYFGGELWGPQYMQEFSLPADVWAEYQEVQADESVDGPDKTQQLEQLLEEHASEETKEYSRLIEEAVDTIDDAERTDLYLQAAKIREETYLILPVAWLDAPYAVRPTVQGLDLRPTLDAYYLRGVSLDDE